jgi:hypothetical protein
LRPVGPLLELEVVGPENAEVHGWSIATGAALRNLTGGQAI